MDVMEYNKRAWDHQVTRGNEWTIPVSPEQIEKTRAGDLQVLLTPTKAVPPSWFPVLGGLRVLALACGGGQQAPLLAAAGARVIVLDASPAQLEQDRMVAEREQLAVDCVPGDMADLPFDDEQFDLIFHPVSNCFVPDVRPVWREAARVLRRGGTMLAGISNPVQYLFDDRSARRGDLTVRHTIPYSDLTSISEEERQQYLADEEPLCFGHTLTDQIGGQIEAGFVITGFFEDGFPPGEEHVLDRYIQAFIATRAYKP